MKSSSFFLLTCLASLVGGETLFGPPVRVRTTSFNLAIFLQNSGTQYLLVGISKVPR
eukprot:SAG11_NODE_363_length_10162_cov_28.285004_6_plen_57_part_00